jgi:hypothetical protein
VIDPIDIHVTLDVAGTLDPTPTTDLLNATLYFSEGDLWNASISVVGALLPYAGDLLKGLKYAVKAPKTTATAEQLANLARFEKKLPANATPTKVFDLPNGGKVFQADSASRNIPGSFAQYEKQVDAAGNTLQYTKTTFGPNSEIIHLKDKIGGGTFP